MQWKEGSNDLQWLDDYSQYLKERCAEFLDTKALETNIAAHTIISTIPIGYGLGSSGALTAAIYDHFCKHKVDLDFVETQERMGLMESFFHGQSSGFDPLISYYQKPLKKAAKVSVLESLELNFPYYIYLLDSKKPRQGRVMIQAFLEKYQSDKDAIQPLINENEKAIESLITGDTVAVFAAVEKISALQFELMEFMILPELKEAWQQGIQQRDCFIKICGAGGGGYYLVFSKNKKEQLENFQLLPVF